MAMPYGLLLLNETRLGVLPKKKKKPSATRLLSVFEVALEGFRPPNETSRVLCMNAKVIR